MGLSSLQGKTLSSQESKRLLQISEMMAKNVVGRYYPEFLDDAISQAFTYACQAYLDGKTIGACKQAAKNGAIDYLRSQIGRHGNKKTFYRSIPLDDLQFNESHIRRIDDKSTSVDNVFNEIFSSEYIERALRWVKNSRCRRILKLFYREGFNSSEIARKLKITESQASRLRAEGLSNIKRMIEDSIVESMGSFELLDLLSSGNRCFRCNLIKPSSEFRPTKTKVLCNTCHRKSYEKRLTRHREYYWKKKSKNFQLESAELHGCSACQRILPLSKFPVDHPVHCLECRRVLYGWPVHPNREPNGLAFLRACWSASWDLGLVHGDRYISKQVINTISGYDIAKRHTLMPEKIISINPSIPAEFIRAWFGTGTSEFNVKYWAYRYSCHFTTIQRWIRSIWEQAKEIVDTLPPMEI